MATRLTEYHLRSNLGSHFHDLILGGQDGMVNVLGVVLAIAAATNQANVVIIAGVAANLAESLSMGAVAYTSTKAYRQYYYAQLETEKSKIEQMPARERKEVYAIYYNKGFRGNLLKKMVAKITSSQKLWLDTLMVDKLKLSFKQVENPFKAAFIVGISALVGSTIPLLPFFFMPVKSGIIVSLIASTFTLFALGALKAKFTVGNWFKNGAELALIGIITALVGYGIGLLLGKMA